MWTQTLLNQFSPSLIIDTIGNANYAARRDVKGQAEHMKSKCILFRFRRLDFRTCHQV